MSNYPKGASKPKKPDTEERKEARRKRIEMERALMQEISGPVREVLAHMQVSH